MKRQLGTRSDEVADEAVKVSTAAADLHVGPANESAEQPGGVHAIDAARQVKLFLPVIDAVALCLAAFAVQFRR